MRRRRAQSELGSRANNNLLLPSHTSRLSDGIASGDFVRRETVGQHDLKNSVPILEPAVETAPFGLLYLKLCNCVKELHAVTKLYEVTYYEISYNSEGGYMQSRCQSA